jgi:DivIVA domain-containing protein
VTTFLQVIAVAAIVFGVVILVTGRGRGLDDVEPDLADNRLPDGPIGAKEVEDVKFSLAVRGYRMDEVDDALDRVAEELGRRDAMIAELRAQVSGAPMRAPLSAPADDEARWGQVPVEVAPLPEGALTDVEDDELDEIDELDDDYVDGLEAGDVTDEDDVSADDLDEPADVADDDSDDGDEALSDDGDEAPDTVPFSAAQATFAGNEEWIDPGHEHEGDHVDDVAEKVAEHQIGVAPWSLSAGGPEAPADDDDAEDADDAAEDTDDDPAAYTPEPVAVVQPEDRPAWSAPETVDEAEDDEPAAAPGAADDDDAEDANPYRPKLPPFFRQ